LTLSACCSIITAWTKSIGEKAMIELFTATFIFAFCMFGCSMTAFFLGRQEGIENTVQYLIDEGVLNIDDEEY
jgi:hypothetical protein